VGPNAPTHIIGGFATVNLPYGLTISARGEYQGGHYIYDGAAWNAIRRSVIWPGCYDVYNIIEKQGYDQTTAKQRAMCDVEWNRQSYLIYPADFFKIREITASIPIPDRFMPWGEDASFTLSGRNVWRWLNDDFPVLDPEMTSEPGRHQFGGIPGSFPPRAHSASTDVDRGNPCSLLRGGKP
jgi:hypothetical protein